MTGPGATAAAAGEENTIVPRWMVAAIVAILVLLLVADVGAQFIPGSGHKADPILDGALLAIIGGVVAASRGPQPTKPAPPDPEPEPVDTGPPRRRHRAPDNGDQP